MASMPTDRSSRENDLMGVSMALLAGLLVMGYSVFLVTLADIGIGPPTDAAPLFVWNATAAAIALVLTYQRHRYAYGMSILTGLLVVWTLASIAMSGGIDTQSSPLGPLTYLGMAVAVIGVALASWRRERLTTSRSAEGIGQ